MCNQTFVHKNRRKIQVIFLGAELLYDSLCPSIRITLEGGTIEITPKPVTKSSTNIRKRFIYVAFDLNFNSEISEFEINKPNLIFSFRGQSFTYFFVTFELQGKTLPLRSV